mmetsp:Transcript_36818/g.72399  ORF Transcript_36818/g.72399 Transcript_36818/m.72399 type:complete len:156 (+) Transcript_36818:1219-1686(+)
MLKPRRSCFCFVHGFWIPIVVLVQEKLERNIPIADVTKLPFGSSSASEKSRCWGPISLTPLGDPDPIDDIFFRPFSNSFALSSCSSLSLTGTEQRLICTSAAATALRKAETSTEEVGDVDDEDEEERVGGSMGLGFEDDFGGILQCRIFSAHDRR